MLEDKIEALTWAVAALTKAIGGMQAPAMGGGFSSFEMGVPLKFDDKVELPKVTSTLTMPDLPESKNTPATSPISENVFKPVTYNDVAKLVTQIAKTNIPMAKAALARLGVKHGKELTEAQWPEAVTYLARVAAGEVDPEASHE